MAELIRGKMQPRVDLTPMVDLAFLLITFFMLTTSLAKPKMMDIALPDKVDLGNATGFSDKRTMTILLGANHQAAWYWGLQKTPIEGPKVTDFGRNGIRAELKDKMTKIKSQQVGSTKPLMVIIRPSNLSSYSDLVNILDEMKINGITQYAIGDISREEVQLLIKLGLYRRI